MVVGDSCDDYRSLWRGRSYGYLSSRRSASGYDCASGYGSPGGCRHDCSGGSSSHDCSGGGATNPDNPRSRRAAHL